MDYQPTTEAVTRRYSSSPAQVSADARWVTRQRVPPVPGQKGPALVSVPPALSVQVQRMLDAAAPSVSAAYNRHIRPVAVSALAGWPVRTGYMASTIALEYEVGKGGTTYSGVVTVDSERPKGAYMVRFYRPRKTPDRFSELERRGKLPEHLRKYLHADVEHSPLPAGARHGENVYRFLLDRPLSQAAMRIADEVAEDIPRRAR